MSENNDSKGGGQDVYRVVLVLFSSMIVIVLFSIFHTIVIPKVFDIQPATTSAVENDEEVEFKDGIHLRTGLIEAPGVMTVIGNCTSCHSSKIILQNRMSAESWNTTIKWMQETQNLWDLGENQEIIVNYLVTNYPIEDKGRRENLSDIDWYELEN
jgi:hypothetical protein